MDARSVEKEQLIEAVRSRPGLWDMSSVNYKNIHLRNRLWMEVLLELGIEISKENIKIISKKFTSLKYRYQQWIQGTTASGSGGIAKDFPCMRLLSFLNDSVRPRQSTSVWNSIEIELEDTEGTQRRKQADRKQAAESKQIDPIAYENIECIGDFDIQAFDLNSEKADDILTESDMKTLEIQQTEDVQSLENNFKAGSARKAKKKKHEEDIALEKIKIRRENLELKKDFLNARKGTESSDSKRLFCDMLYADLRDMDMQKFRKVREKIQKIVDEACAESP